MNTTYTRPINLNPPGTDYVRLIRAMLLAEHKNFREAVPIAESWANSPAVVLELQARAAIPVMDMSDPETADLSPVGVAQEFISLFRSASIIGRIRNLARLTPFKQAVPREVTAPSAIAWTSEGGRKPVGRMTVDNVELLPTKSSQISVFSKELARLSKPPAEATIRTSMVRSMRDFVDNQFLDPTITAIAGTRPASILNGAPSTSSTGSTLAQIQTDLSGMTGQLTTWESPIWTMHPKTLTRLEIVGGGTLLRNNGAQPLLLGYPVFTSTASPAQIALIDAGNILLADGPVRVDFSDQVNVVLDDGGSPNELQFVNLWQTNLAGVLTELFINYERAYSGSAVYMAVAY